MAKKIFFIVYEINNLFGFASNFNKQEVNMNSEEYKEISYKNGLENNLELVIFSRFKHIAGDRCQVTFEASIDVDIKEDYFRDEILNNLDISKVTSILGNSTSYSYSKTRNFIAQDEKNNIFEDMKQQFLDTSLQYISSPSFPAKLIKRNYVIGEKEEMIRLQKEAYLKGK